MAVTENRRKFRDESKTARCDPPGDAAVQTVARGGAPATGLRTIAGRAGVTPGRVRHSFQSGQGPARAARGRVTDRMTGESLKGPDTTAVDPDARLSAFVAALPRLPPVDATTPGLRTAFIPKLRIAPPIRLAHEADCPSGRGGLRQRLAALPRPAVQATPRARAVACTAVSDALWPQGPDLPEAVAAGETPRIGLTSVGANVNLDLLSHLPEAP